MIEHLRALAVFAKTVELGSFRAAARALSLSPSVVSHHISKLEEHLALPLLYRSTRRLALTAEGKRLQAAAADMLQAAERGIDALSQDGKTPRGELRLAAPAFLATTSLCRDLAELAAAHPQVQLRLSFSDAPIDLLRDGFDLALRIGRVARTNDSTLRQRKLCEMRRLLVASPHYLRQHRSPRLPRDLAALDYLQLASRPAAVTLSRVGRPASASVTVPFSSRISVDSAAALHGLALAGAGLATLPEILVRADLSRGSLVELLPSWQVQSMGVYLLWPKTTQRPGLTALCSGFLRPRIAELFAGASHGQTA